MGISLITPDLIFPVFFVLCVGRPFSFTIVIYKLFALKRCKDFNDNNLFYSFILIISNVLFVTMERQSLQERLFVVKTFYCHSESYTETVSHLRRIMGWNEAPNE